MACFCHQSERFRDIFLESPPLGVLAAQQIALASVTWRLTDPLRFTLSCGHVSYDEETFEDSGNSESRWIRPGLQSRSFPAALGRNA